MVFYGEILEAYNWIPVVCLLMAAGDTIYDEPYHSEGNCNGSKPPNIPTPDYMFQH